MGPNKKTARIAGLLYLVVALSGMFSLLYIPSKIIVWDDAAQTFNNILAKETLFRLGIVAGVILYTSFAFLPLVLYKLLSHVSKPHAIAMVTFALVSVPFSLVNLINKVNVLTLVSSQPYLRMWGREKLQAEVLLNLHYYENGIQLVSIFWGLWLFPFGYLVFKSGLVPKVLGILLIVGCFGYLIDFIGRFLFKGYEELGLSVFISLPSGLGEIGTCLWLLIAGIKEEKGTGPVATG